MTIGGSQCMKKRITHCLFCERELNSKYGWKELLSKTLPQTICERCEQKFERIKTQTVENVISLFHYNEAMKDFLHRYKFLHDVLLAHVFNRTLHEQLKNDQRMIVPIPMNSENLKIRTFSHIEELLKAANLPYENHLIKLSSEIQSKKSREERLQTAQLFDVIDKTKVKGKPIVLIDDIYTTGTTVQHATNVLIKAGAKEVQALTLIHG